MSMRTSQSDMWDGIVELKTRYICETLMPPEQPFFEKCNLDIRP